MALTYLAPALTMVLEVARRNGVEPTPLLRDLAIDPARIEDPDYRLRIEQVIALQAALEAKLPENAPLELHGVWNPNALGVLGHGWLTSPSLRSAFERLARFSRIVTEGVGVAVVEGTVMETPAVSLELGFHEPERAPRLRMSGTQALLLAMCQALAGRDFHPLEVTLAHTTPEESGPWFALFQCPVRFGAPRCRFSIAAEVADAPLAPVPAQLAQLHDQLMLDYLAGMESSDLAEKVKAVIVELLPSGQVTDAKVAHELFMTPRTLQRRLKERGTTFKSLLTEVRHELATHYLRDGRYSLSEISYLLGFSELSAFSRAFKRWAGVAPSAYRAG